MHSESGPDDDGLLAGIRALLGATPAPDLESLAEMLERVQPLTERPDDGVARQARQLELRLLGAILTRQSETLRALARQLQSAARWLPPEQVGQN